MDQVSQVLDWQPCSTLSEPGHASADGMLRATSRSAAGSGADGGAVTDLRGLWHPLVGGVPNDVRLGVPADGAADGADETAARTLLLTGPNMGGKSTLLRATCLAVIMAHVRKSRI